MPRETKAQRAARAVELIRRLAQAMPEARIELAYSTPLELLVAVLLSAQTTDKRVNLVTPALFSDFRSAEDYARATPRHLEGYLRTVGLFRNKAKALVRLGAALLERHGGMVPVRRDELVELPGVGNKTAGVVSMHLGGDRALPVDTHVHRLSHRLGLSAGAAPDEVERDLRALLPEAQWFDAHQLLIWHGRRVCAAQRPACHHCVLADLCPRKGVGRKFQRT